MTTRTLMLASGSEAAEDETCCEGCEPGCCEEREPGCCEACPPDCCEPGCCEPKPERQ